MKHSVEDVALVNGWFGKAKSCDHQDESNPWALAAKAWERS